MNFEEIKKRLTELLANPIFEEISTEAGELSKSFQQLLEARPSRAESNLEEIDVDEDLIQDIKSLVKNYRERREQIRKERADQEKKNLVEKQNILNELTRVISEEENISKAYNTFNDLKEKWRAIGNVPGDKHHEIQREFARLSELFYYNMNIYKELRENDLKKNTGSKTELIEKLKELLNGNNIREMESGLRLIQREWDHTGAVVKELWEEMRNTFWDQVKLVQDKIASLKEEKKSKQSEFLAQKQKLVEQVAAINQEEKNGQKDWDKYTEKIIAIQNKWKLLGYASKEDNEKIWQEFRTVCDEFFTAKKEFYSEIKGVYDENKKLKIALIEKAEALKDSKDWKEAGNKIISLQKEWQKIGSAGKKSEHTLWLKFRAICDHFFQNKKEHFSAQEVAMDENLKKKEALIASLSSIQIEGDDDEKINQLSALSKEFNTIGHVPMKERDRIQKEFKQAFDNLSIRLNIDHSKKEQKLFQTRIESISGQENASYLLNKERQFIREKINKINEEIVRIENNLGFFANSKNASDLLKDYQTKIENHKSEIEQLKGRLKLIPKV